MRPSRRSSHERHFFHGSFDPVTNGHLWLVARSLALDLFDGIIVGVVNDPARTTVFTIDERLAMWLANAEAVNERRIEIVAIDDEYPVRAARRLDCQFLLRGIRAAQEYEAEVTLQKTNHHLEPMVQTVFLVPDDELAPHLWQHGAEHDRQVGVEGGRETIRPRRHLGSTRHEVRANPALTGGTSTLLFARHGHRYSHETADLQGIYGVA